MFGKISRLFVSMLMLISVSTAYAAGVDDEFPLRGQFSDIAPIEINDFKSRINEFLAIDVRSPFEYEVMHIDSAINIPISSKTFVKMVLGAQAESGKPVAFYCYGHHCEKSYFAAKKIKAAGVKFDFVVFDGGITDWSKKYPEKTVSFGKPTDLSRMISDSDFNKRLLDPLDFIKQVQNNDSIGVIDIRYSEQIGEISIFPGRDYRTRFDIKKLKSTIEAIKEQGMPVYIYDDAGYQVRYVQYLLEEMGVKDYMFMKDGVSGYFKAIKN